jgi:Fe-S-cluster-containing hydrogenase component 2
MILVDNPEACTGCHICEMVCSSHHCGRFSISNASLRVSKSLFNPQKGAQIVINYEDRNMPVCDQCQGEELPLCIAFCPEDVFKIKGGGRG